MRVNRLLVPILALVAIFGTVLVAQATGNFATNGRAGTDIARLTPADLKGWMTLQDVMNGLQISRTDLYAAGKIPSDIPPSTALNKLESKVPGFSVTSLRAALTAKPLPATSADSQPTPPSAMTPAPENIPAVAPESHATPTSLPAGQVLPASQIKGKMSLKEISTQCAVPLDRLLAGLNLPANTDANTVVKDLVSQGKLKEVSDVQQVVGQLQSR